MVDRIVFIDDGPLDAARMPDRYGCDLGYEAFLDSIGTAPPGFRRCDHCSGPTRNAKLCGICTALAEIDDDEGLLRDDD